MFPLQCIDNLIAEERAVDSCFEHSMRTVLPHTTHAFQDELLGSAGIMDIARPMKEVQYLSCLRDGAEQRIVTSSSLLPFVEAHGSALSPPRRRLHRAVKVERDARKGRHLQTSEYLCRHQTSQRCDLAVGRITQHATEGGFVSDPAHAQHSFHQGIILIAGDVTQAAKPKQQMQDQLEKKLLRAINLSCLPPVKDCPELLQQVELGKQLLENDDASKSGELMGLKAWDGRAIYNWRPCG